jgi:hypothetical protein
LLFLSIKQLKPITKNGIAICSFYAISSSPSSRNFTTVAKVMNEVAGLFIRPWLLSPISFPRAALTIVMLADIVWIVAQSAPILHLHGHIKITLAAPLNDVVVSNTQSLDQKTIITCLG